jgi:hypothetical protein
VIRGAWARVSVANLFQGGALKSSELQLQ